MSENNSFEVDLDLLDEEICTEEVEINPDLDPLAQPAPVSDGVHRVKVIQAPGAAWEAKSWTGKDGVEHPYLACKFRLQILDEGPDFNKVIFPNAINTITFDGKNQMAHLLVQILGGTAEAKSHVKSIGVNYVALGKAFKAALVGEPVVKAQTRWVASYKTGEQKKGRPVYKVAVSGQRNFKKNLDGSFDPNVVTKGGEAKARPEVIAYFPDES